MALSSLLSATGAMAVVAWLVAAGIHAWRGEHSGWLPQALTRLGLLLALAGWLSTVAGVWPDWAAAPAANASGIAIAALSIHALLSSRHREVVFTVSVTTGALLMQAYAVSATLWAADPPAWRAGVLTLWLIARDVTAVVAAGALAVSLCAAVAAARLARLPRRAGLSGTPTEEYLAQVEDATLRLALPSLTLSLSMAAVRSWLGWGEVVQPGMAGFLIAWLLLVAAFGGVVTGAASTRLARALTALSLAATLTGVLGFV